MMMTLAKPTKANLVDIIKKDVSVNPLEKFTKPQLLKMAKEQNIKVTYHYTKPEIMFLLSNNDK